MVDGGGDRNGVGTSRHGADFVRHDRATIKKLGRGDVFFHEDPTSIASVLHTCGVRQLHVIIVRTSTYSKY